MTISLKFVVLFYGVMALIAWLVADVWLDLDMWSWSQQHTPLSSARHPLVGLASGAAVGLASVVLSQLLDRYTTWAKRLGEAFKEMLGALTTWQILVIAATSSVCEELLFRGCIEQALALRLFDGFAFAVPAALILSSLLFGGMHIGPDRQTFLPWTIMAVVMGGVFGGLFWWTGDLTAPIVAHFTINFLNLTLMQEGPTE